MSPEARITVVVPAYNGERYLRQTLASIAEQTFDGWRAVIVDDGSTDSTRAVAAEFERAHPDRVLVIGLDRNVGVAEARNVAIRSAPATDLIALLDQDDRWCQNYLDRVVEMFDARIADGGHPGIIACDGWIETPDGIVGTFAECYWWRDRIDYEALLTRNYILARAAFSRRAYEQVGEFCAACALCDDYDMWLRIAEAGYEVLTTRTPLVVYRIHPGAQSRDQLLLTRGTITVHRRALERGALTRGQRRRVRARIRHLRAVAARAQVAAAAAERRPLIASALALKAAPPGLVALLQDPWRWGEWAVRLARSALGRPAASPRRR